MQATGKHPRRINAMCGEKYVIIRVRILGLRPHVHAGSRSPISRHPYVIAEMSFHNLSVLPKVVVQIITAPP